MEVRYPDTKSVCNFDALLAAHHHQRPEIVKDSVMELTEAEFNDMYPKAEAEIQRKSEQSQDKAFWGKAETAQEAPMSPDNSSHSQLDWIIWRPYIACGQITVIESAPSVGKSCVTTAICAQLAGSKAPFLEERCLIPCAPWDNPKRGYKILYAVFDNDGDLIDAHRKDFANDLGENACNFIQENMVGDLNNYTKEANYPAFKQWLNSYCNVGTPGQPVDVLVIDTSLEFAKGKINDVHLMLRKLVSDYPNMAIILIHHLNKENDTYGGIKATMLPRVILKLYRTKEQQEAIGDRKPTLCDPFSLSVEKFNANKIAEDGESFALRFNEQQHFVVINPVRTQAQMHKILIENYGKKYDADQKTIARLLGTTDRTIRNWNNAADKQ